MIAIAVIAIAEVPNNRKLLILKPVPPVTPTALD
jgi:hypothetical protein